MSEIRIYSDSLVTPRGLIAGEVVIRDGAVHAVDAARGPSSGALDWSGDWLIPGLIDIHTDNLEKHYQIGRAHV